MPSQAHSHHAFHRPSVPAGHLWRRIGQALGVWRQRRSLAQLDDHLLSDLGLTRAEAAREARRAMWDVPPFWRR